MPPKQLTIKFRAKEYASEGFFIQDLDAGIIMCAHCNCRIDWEKKSSCDNHCKAAKHQSAKDANETISVDLTLPTMVEQESHSQAMCSSSSITTTSANPSAGIKRLTNIKDSLNNLKRMKDNKEEFILDTVGMCVKANIPLERLDNEHIRSYLDKYIKGINNFNNDQKQFVKVDGKEITVSGRCDLSAKAQQCQDDLQKKYGNIYGNPYGVGDNASFNRTQFFVGIVFGVVIIAASVFMPATISIIGISLAISGVIILIRSTFNYWNYFTDVWKFGILVIAFVALVILVVKKLKK